MSYRGRNKRKPYFSSNLMAKKKKDLFLQSRMKGFICTCNGNEKQCIRESYNILNEYADRLYGEEKPKQQMDPNVMDEKGDKKSDDNRGDKKCNEKGDNKYEDEGDEIDDFQKEVDALKTQNKTSGRRFQAVDTGIANCVFIKTNLEDPTGLCDVIMRDLADTKLLKARFLMRIIPIEITCHAQLDDILKNAGQLLDRHFKTDPLTYAIAISKRCNSSLERDPLIEKLAGMVQERNHEHKVNLSSPAVTIIVEAMKGICGLAVIRDYSQLGKYNLRQICGLPLNDQGDVGNAKSSSTHCVDEIKNTDKGEGSTPQTDSVVQAEKNAATDEFPLEKD